LCLRKLFLDVEPLNIIPLGFAASHLALYWLDDWFALMSTRKPVAILVQGLWRKPQNNRFLVLDVCLGLGHADRRGENEEASAIFEVSLDEFFEFWARYLDRRQFQVQMEDSIGIWVEIAAQIDKTLHKLQLLTLGADSPFCQSTLGPEHALAHGELQSNTSIQLLRVLVQKPINRIPFEILLLGKCDNTTGTRLEMQVLIIGNFAHVLEFTCCTNLDWRLNRGHGFHYRHHLNIDISTARLHTLHLLDNLVWGSEVHDVHVHSWSLSKLAVFVEMLKSTFLRVRVNINRLSLKIRKKKHQVQK